MRSIKKICALLKKVKKRLLKLHFDTNTGHIGGNFSCIDTLIVLHHLVMKSSDRFILSKGHSAAALYLTLWSMGKISEEDLETYAKDNTFFACHPSGAKVPGLLFHTGSLGHGFSLATGLAMAAKHKKINRQIFCLCSDGEWQEGSCWEALAFAVHHKLKNLTILIDENGLQGFNRVSEVISGTDLKERIAAFGACVRRVDGHNLLEIKKGLTPPASGKPLVLILKTLKGHGLHFENLLESHYLPLTETQYNMALKKIDEDLKL
ncbi:MAG: transketolase [Proteobacteria bacterium]|nr:transketolase [Pseudomonadota bacterium]NBS06010.1 transketolase [Verrucomicrobiota bacterium]NBS49137.1 transketolase [Verrucomicrobiota bacterium]NBS78450.1 transketolase [bacterium]